MGDAASIAVLGLRLVGVDMGERGRLAARVSVYGAAAAGGLKWILIIWRLAAFGAWIGLLLLLGIGILNRSTGWASAEQERH